MSNNQEGISNLILGINSTTDEYPWEVVGGAFNGVTMCNGSGGQGIGGIGPSCCDGSKQGDTNI